MLPLQQGWPHRPADALPPCSSPSWSPTLPAPSHRTVQLCSLGVLLGFSYVRSRNLLTPMLIHGAWNGSVLTILFFLASQGVDIQELIHAN